MTDPFNHVCDIGTIDYSRVDAGQLYCRVCKKEWKFTPSGWVPRPRVRYKPKGDR